MALTTVKIGNTGGDYTSYVAMDPAEYVSNDDASRALLTGRNLQDKYIDWLLTKDQKAYLYANMGVSTDIDLVAMP